MVPFCLKKAIDLLTSASVVTRALDSLPSQIGVLIESLIYAKGNPQDYEAKEPTGKPI